MADYVLNMGGNSGASENTVDIFKVTANGVEAITDHGLTLSTARYELAAAAAGNYVLAMGGYASSGRVNTVDVFKVTENGVEAVTDHGLTLSVARNFLAAAAAGNYVLAMGGYASSGRVNTVDVFKVTENGVEAVTDHGLTLSVARNDLAAAASGEYILAMGGRDGSGRSNAVDVFHVTANGVEAVTGHGLTLSTARFGLSAAACGNYILAMGGRDGPSTVNTVDVFKVTESGVEAVPDHGLTLSVARETLAAAASGEYILAMGGSASSGRSNAVDVFKVTENGVEAVPDHGLTLSVVRSSLSAAAAGNCVLAMGGYASSGRVHTIDVFQIFN